MNPTAVATMMAAKMMPAVPSTCSVMPRATVTVMDVIKSPRSPRSGTSITPIATVITARWSLRCKVAPFFLVRLSRLGSARYEFAAATGRASFKLSNSLTDVNVMPIAYQARFAGRNSRNELEYHAPIRVAAFSLLFLWRTVVAPREFARC